MTDPAVRIVQAIIVGVALIVSFTLATQELRQITLFQAGRYKATSTDSRTILVDTRTGDTWMWTPKGWKFHIPGP